MIKDLAMSYPEHAIRALILHNWKDAKEWASALTVLGELTDTQLDDQLPSGIVSTSESVQNSRRSEKANSRFRR